MCARYTLVVPDGEFQEHFELLSPPGLQPRYNIAPSQPVAVVGLKADGSARGLVRMNWGFVPRWAKSPTDGPRPVNAKAETVRTSAPFRASFRDRRCLIPATGYFEWLSDDTGKVPYLFHKRDGGPFAFAGIWDLWKPTDGSPPLFTCAIITVEANRTCRLIHNRMPAILEKENYSDWLDSRRPTDAIHELLRSAPDDYLAMRPVNRIVNKAMNNVPDCLLNSG